MKIEWWDAHFEVHSQITPCDYKPSVHNSTKLQEILFLQTDEQKSGLSELAGILVFP